MNKMVYASVLLITLVARTCEAFGKAGFGQFCFDDSKGIATTGLQTCAQVVAQGHCRTESYSKYCHRTCEICTDGVSFVLARCCHELVRNSFMLTHAHLSACVPSHNSIEHALLCTRLLSNL